MCSTNRATYGWGVEPLSILFLLRRPKRSGDKLVGVLNHYTFGLFDGVGLSCDFPCLVVGKVGGTHLVGVGVEPRQISIGSGGAGEG